VPYQCQRFYQGQPITVVVAELAVPRCAHCGELDFDYEAEEQINRAYQEQINRATSTSDGGPMQPLPADVASLSLTARLGVALHLFAGYCRRRGLDHPAIGRYIEHMWAFTVVPGGGVDLDQWESGRPDLVDAGLGYELPEGFADHLAERGVAEPEFRSALMHCTEVLYSSLWGAADNAGSLREVAGLAAIALQAGVAWPDLSAFAASPWLGGGWSGPLTAEELARWRNADKR
jgi:hypothetical protein